MKTRCMRLAGLAGLIGLVALANGCARYGPYKPRGFQRILGDGLVAEYDSNRDRVTRFGPRGRFNLLYVNDLDRAPSPSGQFTHFGGMYTWVAPQEDWRDRNGNAYTWPPNSAMDAGPTFVSKHGLHEFEATGPILPSGLQEIKSMHLGRDDYGPRALVTNSLRNTTDEPIEAGPWVTTGVVPGSVIAVLTPESDADLALSRHPDAQETWDNTTRQRSQWTLIRTKRYYWWLHDADTMKVRFPSDRVIAIHRRGHWLVRIGEPVKAEANPSIATTGHAPVEVAVNFGSRIHEASLIAPIGTIAPGEQVDYVERWYIIPGMASRVRQLDDALYAIDPIRFPKPMVEEESDEELRELEDWLEGEETMPESQPTGPIDVDDEPAETDDDDNEPFIDIDDSR